MLSNKLTFSLAFIVMFAIIAAPAMAQRELGADDMVYMFTTDAIPGAAGDPGNDEFDARYVLLTRTAAGTPAGSELGIQNLPVASAIRRSTADATTGVVSAPTDLKRFLENGGTIELQLQVATYPAAQGDLNEVVYDLIVERAKKKATDEAVAAAKFEGMRHNATITEIMWGYDDETTTKQWIEVFNNSGADIPVDMLRMVFIPDSQIDPALFPQYVSETDVQRDGTDDENVTLYVVLDRVSTVNRFGTSWDLKGQDGNTEITAATAAGEVVRKGLIDLISMYRKRDLEDADTPKTYKGDSKFGDGTADGQWEASARRANMPSTYVATPLWVHKVAKTFARTVASSSAGPVINEVRNDTSDTNLDWIEIYNNGTAAVNIKDWELTIVFVDDDESTPDMDLAALSPDMDYMLGGEEYLVIANDHPDDTILAGGTNIDVPANEHINKGTGINYAVRTTLKLPNDRPFFIVLRSHREKNGTSEHIEDYAGNLFVKRSDKDWETDVWPLQGTPTLGDVEPFDSPTFTSGDNNSSWGRKRYMDNDGHHKDAWDIHGAQGGIGYVPRVDLSFAPGTPGYANNAVAGVLADDMGNTDAADDYAFSGMVSISEIMYDAGPRWNLIQWIELYNSSMTEAIDLKDWMLEIRNKEDVESYVDSGFVFEDGAIILPNQTLLLVSGGATNNVPDNRVYNLYENHRDDLGLQPSGRRSVLLSRSGFNLKLWEKDADRQTDDPVDEAGNVEVKGAQRNITWDLPARDPAARQSLVRQYGTRAVGGVDRGMDPADIGTMAESWLQSDIAGAGISYYGHRNDISTPGYRLGGPLPVELSSFRPVRDKATGEVVITWITESELNNAGFNILRREGKDGAFKVINLQGIIAGHGTTSEKHVYTFTDKTAMKPNVAYYYQIEDVSLDGNRTTLGTTHLRGNVNAAGKVTTTWGDLKLQK